MSMSPRLRDVTISVLSLAAVAAAVIAIDLRVRSRFGTLFGGGAWAERFRSLANTIADTIALTIGDQRFDNVVLLIFIGVALGLVLFLLRT